MSFFRPGNFPCPLYCQTRDQADKCNTLGREFIEALWLDCAEFVDPDALQRATISMPTVFGELYVAHALKNSGISLQRQARTKQNQKGPDLFASNPDVWIEAITPEIGNGPDAMQIPPMGVVYDTPMASFILRLRHAFAEKERKIKDYIKAGPIEPGQATVIAISGAMLPTAIGEGPIPRILKAFLGLGDLVIELDRGTRQMVDHSVEHRDEVKKKSGTLINTAPFLDSAYSHISAVLYSPYNWVTHPKKPGVDFTVVHNENADIKLPRGWLQVGDEYWREENQLHSALHSTDP